MNQNTTAEDIENGFKAMGGGVKEAGKKRVNELVAQQGYVGFRSEYAAAKFREDPDYAGWSVEFIDGEYRFYPPKLMEQAPTKETNSSTATEIIEQYKQLTQDLGTDLTVAIDGVKEDRSKCRYRLISRDKRTGEAVEIRKETLDFEGPFIRQVVPTIYSKMSGGLPTIDYEKGESDSRYLTLQNIDNNRVMLFGNLTDEQMMVVMQMREYVDGKNLGINPSPAPVKN